MPTLQTNRINLRAWRPDDAEDLLPIVSDPEVMKYIQSGKPWKLRQAQEFVDRQIQKNASLGFCLWAAEYRQDSRLIGYCGLQHLDETGDIEIAWCLAQSDWRRGIGTEMAKAVVKYAFQELGIDRLVAISQPANKASTKITQKIGMRRQKDTTYFDIPAVQYVIDSVSYRP